MIDSENLGFLQEENPMELRKQILGLETLLELTRSLMVIQERNRLDGFLLLTVMGMLSVSRAILLTVVNGEDRFRVYTRGVKEEEIHDRLGLKPSGVFARRMRVAEGLTELGAGGLPGRDGPDLELLRGSGIRYAVPIRVKEKLRGVLLLGERVHAAELSSFESQMLRSILDIAATVMDNTDLVNEMRDTTRAMEAQNERLLELDKLKTQFLSNVGHELRTPLTCMAGFAECLRYPDVEEERRIEFAGNILRQSEKLTNLINQILDLSEITHETMKIEPEGGDLNKIVKEVTDSLRSTIDARGVIIDFDLTPSLPKTRFDPEKTKRVIQNLLDNAIKFSHEEGKVRITSRVDEEGIALSVRDEGVGIPREALPTIFDSFRQVDGSETRVHGGAGIGLSLVKEIMESQSGTVSVSSDPGRGSVFTIHLPRDQDEETLVEDTELVE